MNCFFVTNHLSGLMDGQLAPDALAEVEQHLKVCVGCRRHWEEMLHLKANLKQVRIPDYNQTARTKTRYILTRQKLKTPWTRYFIFSPITLALLSILTLSAAIWSHRYPKPLRPVAVLAESAVGQSADGLKPVATAAVEVTPSPTPTPTPQPTPTLTPAPTPVSEVGLVPTPVAKASGIGAVATPTPVSTPTLVPEPTAESPAGATLDVRITNQTAEDLQAALASDCKKVKCRNLAGKKEIEFHSSEDGEVTTTVVIFAREFSNWVERVSKWGEVTPQALPPEIQEQLAAPLTLRIVLIPKA